MRYRVYITVLMVSLYSFSSTGFAQDIPEIKPSFKNDICLPAKIYMLSEVQNNIFVEPLIKRWRPCGDVVRFSGTAKYQRRLQRVASIGEHEDAATVSLSLINQDYFDTIKTVTSAIVVGKKRIGADTVTVSIIGDSFTQGAFFKDALLVNYPDMGTSLAGFIQKYR